MTNNDTHNSDVILDNTNNSLPYANVNHVTVKVPPFRKRDPSIWFAQVEAQFELSGITNDTTKYNHIVCTIDTEILSQVSNIIQNLPEQNKHGV